MKQQLLNELQHETFAALSPSSVHGIGVVAIQKIPKGTRNIFSTSPIQWELLSFNEVEQLPVHSKYLVENFCLFSDTHYYVPQQGFKVMDLCYYLNHSDIPNLISVNEGEYFEAIVDIEPGTELVIDYGTLVDSDE